MSQRTPLCWLRFSLKSLFLLVLVVAAYFAGWRSAIWTAEREKEEAVRKAVEELAAARQHEGARVGFAVAPELDMVIVTGPPENADRVQRFMHEFPGKVSFRGSGFGSK